MQTLVLQVAREPMDQRMLEQARSRVESHYAASWSTPPMRHEARGDTFSMTLWQTRASPSTWPAWHEDAGTSVASLYVPLGFERVTGPAPLTRAPGALADALVSRPGSILELAAPFVLARVAAGFDVLDIFTDALGIGRLFEVGTATGWVWSNRPVAALLWAGSPARRDPVGWEQSAVADEFFGVTSPYDGVSAVDGASHVHWDGRSGRRTVSRIDVVASWGAEPSRAGVREEVLIENADTLRSMVTSIATLFPHTPVVDLSGGRDSRLVASAFISSGVEVVLHSHDGVPADLSTALDLVARLPGAPEHRVRHMPTGGQTAPRRFSALESARRWHRHAEGLRPCSFIMHATPPHLDAGTNVVIGGVGGEIAHGYFYPPHLDELEVLPVHRKITEFSKVILGRHASVPGASGEARRRVEGHVHAVLSAIAAQGVTDARMLDFYYLRERMRRWGTTGETLGVFSPLLSPTFLRAALTLAPDDRRANALHRGITRQLVPQWAEVPYFPSESEGRPAPSASAAPPPRILRLAESADADEFTGLLGDVDSWGDAFDIPLVHALWHRSTSGQTTAREEQTLRRVAWSGAFEDHLAVVNGGAPPPRSPGRVPVGSLRPSPPSAQDIEGSRMRRDAVAALRRHPGVRAVVRTRSFRMLWHSPWGRGARRWLDR